MVRVGSDKVQDNKWTAFVKLEDKKIGHNIGWLIDKVRFGLVDGFDAPYKDIRALHARKSGQFSITYVGWGYFDMPITIFWKKETGIL